MNKQIKYRINNNLQQENSYGVIRSEDDILMDCTLLLRTGAGQSEWASHYELFDISSNGYEWYAEGNLCIEMVDSRLTITDYDGMFSLPPDILAVLRKNGISVEEMQESLDFTDRDLESAVKRMVLADCKEQSEHAEPPIFTEVKRHLMDSGIFTSVKQQDGVYSVITKWCSLVQFNDDGFIVNYEPPNSATPEEALEEQNLVSVRIDEVFANMVVYGGDRQHKVDGGIK